MKILIINVTRIGDTLFCVPSIRAIAQHYPDAARRRLWPMTLIEGESD